MSQLSQDRLSPSQSDGRVRRGAANRERIVNSFYALVKEGCLLPTAEQVARRAAVGERTIFRHFEDMEALYSEVGVRLKRRYHPRLRQPLPDGPLEFRVRAIVDIRTNVFEHILPYLRCAFQLLSRSEFLRCEYSRSLVELRQALVHQLAPEVSANDERIEALEVVLSPDVYDRLRMVQNLSQERATRVVTQAAVKLIAD